MIITIPPTYSASVNCQPISTHSTRPSSHTRFVEANWNASAVADDAPFWNRDFAIAIAAYEHDEDAAPSPVASATGFGPDPDSARSIRARGTHAWSIAEIAKPNTSAHQTSQAIKNESWRPCQSTSRTSIGVHASIPQGGLCYAGRVSTPTTVPVRGYTTT